MSRAADLHLHTNYSDSTLTPLDVIEQSAKYGISCIAITDHDTVEGIYPTLEAAKPHQIEVVAGVELSSEINGREVHILGYFIDYHNKRLLEQFLCMQDTRVGRMKKMIDKLKEFGINNVELSEVCALAQTDSVGRPHLATILYEKGWVKSVRAAFDLYISDEGPAYVEKFKQTPEEAIELIRQAGGVAVLAHPMLSGIDERIPQFVEAGLGGIEAYYPNVPKQGMEFYVNLAKKYNLAVTGGSDAHGEAKDNTWIGKLTIPYELVEDLKKRTGR
ncbi:MAG: PHP domain-containing protein [Candidatus Omnitrophica bacterium]|nr:PHP domain-containing protein [Candidatus Omnitrophota bacterium]